MSVVKGLSFFFFLIFSKKKFSFIYFLLGFFFFLSVSFISTLIFTDFLCGSAGKESSYSVGDLGSISDLGRSPGEQNVYPLQYSGLENSMD